jgi:hypothetical protein
MYIKTEEFYVYNSGLLQSLAMHKFLYSKLLTESKHSSYILYRYNRLHEANVVQMCKT